MKLLLRAIIVMGLILVSGPALAGGITLKEACDKGLDGLGDTSLQVTLSNKTAWQPRGGTVILNVTSMGNASVSGKAISACYRWKTAESPPKWQPLPPPHLNFSGNAVSEVHVAIPSDPLPVPLGVGKRFGGAITQMEVMLVVGDPAKPDSIHVNEFGIVSTFNGVLAVVAVLLLLCALACASSRSESGTANPLLRLISAEKGRRASLSQFQVVLWTCVVAVSSAYVLALSGELIPISQTILGLLGISGVALVGVQAAPQTPADLPEDRDPQWSDLILGADGMIDVTRFQMLIFTLITAAFVLVWVFSSYALPEIDGSYLMLMGASNSLYFANKIFPPVKTPPAPNPPQTTTQPQGGN